MTTIFLTGATGFIGSHTARRLNERGLRPRVLVRPTSNTANLQDVDVDLVHGDLSDLASVRQAMQGCDQVIHVAGLVSSKPKDRAKMFASNVQAADNVMTAARELGVQKISYLGSVTALGASEGPTVWQEGMPFNLGSGVPYFESKRAAQAVIQKHLDAGAPIVGIYPTYCLGPGDVYLSSSSLVTNFVAGKVSFVTESGMGFLDARDAGEAMVLGLEKGQIGQRYYLSGHNLTYRDFFTRLAAMAGVEPPRTTLPKWLLAIICTIAEPLTGGEVISRSHYMAYARYYWYDNSRAVNELGWTFRPLDETLRDSLDWLRGAGFLPPVPAGK